MRKIFYVLLVFFFSGILCGQDAEDYKVPLSSLPSDWSQLAEGSPSLDAVVQSTRIRKEVYQELGFQSCFNQVFNTPQGRASVEIYVYSSSRNSSKMFDIDKQLYEQQNINTSKIKICGEDGIKVTLMGVTTYLFTKERRFYVVGGQSESLTRILSDSACSAGDKVVSTGEESEEADSPERKKREKTGSKGMPDWLEFIIILGAVYGVALVVRIVSRLIRRKPKRSMPSPPHGPSPTPREPIRPAPKPRPETVKTRPTSQPKVTWDLTRPAQKPSTKPKVVLNLGTPPQPPPEPEVQEKEKEEREKKRKPVTLELSSNLETLKKDTQKQASIMAVVKDEAGLPLPGEEVTFQSDQGRFKAKDTVTDPSGTARAIWQVDEDSRGVVNIKANCQSNPVVFDILNIQVEEKKEPVSCRTRVIPDKLPADGRSKASVTTQLKDIDDQPVSGWPVTFSTSPEGYENGLSKIQGISDSNGQVNLEFTMPKEFKREKLYIHGIAKDSKGRRIGSPGEITVEKEKPVNIIGTVMSTREKSLEKADIKLINRDTRSSRRSQSGEMGEFQFEELSPGNYQLDAKKEHYEKTDNSDKDFSVQSGETKEIRLELKPSRRMVEQMLESEKRVHDTVIRLLATDKDSYLQTLAWEMAGFAGGILSDIPKLSDGLTGLDKAQQFGLDEMKSGLKEMGIIDISKIPTFSKETVLKRLNAYDFLVGEVWNRVSQYLPIPASDQGFTDGKIKSAMVAMSSLNEVHIMENAIKLAYVESLSWKKYKELVMVNGVQSLGTQLDEPTYIRALIYLAGLMAFGRFYFRDGFQRLEGNHQEMQDFWQKRDDLELLDIFKTEERFNEFNAKIEKHETFLKEKELKLKTYRLSESRIKEILNMGERFFRELAGGPDMYRSKLISITTRSINNLPLAIQGYNYFQATSSLWGILGLIPESGPHEKAFRKLIDMGYKFGAFACLGLGMMALEKDIDSFSEMLGEIVLSSQDEGAASQFIDDWKNF